MTTSVVCRCALAVDGLISSGRWTPSSSGGAVLEMSQRNYLNALSGFWNVEHHKKQLNFCNVYNIMPKMLRKTIFRRNSANSTFLLHFSKNTQIFMFVVCAFDSHPTFGYEFNFGYEVWAMYVWKKTSHQECQGIINRTKIVKSAISKIIVMLISKQIFIRNFRQKCKKFLNNYLNCL